MAVVYWIDGGGDGNWATGANWSSGSKPANSDTAIIGASNRAIIGGTVAETGLTVKFTEGFGGTVGADAPLIFSDTAVVLVYGGKGSYANFGGGTYTTSTFNTSGGQQVVLSTGTHTSAVFSGGTINIAAAVVLTTYENIAATVTIGYNATAITTVHNQAKTDCFRSVTTLNAKRGTFTQYNNGTTTFTLCTTVNIENGGTYNKQSAGTDVTVNAFAGGIFTIAGNAGGSTSSVTVTTLNYRAGSRIVDVGAGIILTVTNRNPIGLGGQVGT